MTLIAPRQLPQLHASRRRRRRMRHPAAAATTVRSQQSPARRRRPITRGGLAAEQPRFLLHCTTFRRVIRPVNHPGVSMDHVPKAAYGAARRQLGRGGWPSATADGASPGRVVDFGPFDLLASE